MRPIEPSESRPDAHPLLHLCGYWNTSSVHAALTAALADACACPQVVFVPCRAGVDAPAFAPAEGVRVVLLPVLSGATRVLYPLKLYRVRRAVRTALARDGIEPRHVHGHTVYADGVVAHAVARDAGCTYSLSVRSTDVHYGTRWHAWAAPLVRRVLVGASSVMLLAPAFADALGRRLRLGKTPAFATLASGLDDAFQALARTSKAGQERRKDSVVRLLTAGKARHKNLVGTCRACLLLLRDGRLGGRSIELEIFGIGAPALETLVDADVLRAVAVEPRLRLVPLGRIDGCEAMARVQARADAFVMPSLTETFGLAYLEAIAMCTPVVYSRGQGIDGLFDESAIGAAVDARDAADVARGIESVLERFPDGLGPFARNPVTDYAWDAIAGRFLDGLERGGVVLPRRART